MNIDHFRKPKGIIKNIKQLTDGEGKLIVSYMVDKGLTSLL